jgi:hypothetical protein
MSGFPESTIETKSDTVASPKHDDQDSTSQDAINKNQTIINNRLYQKLDDLRENMNKYMAIARQPFNSKPPVQNVRVAQHNVPTPPVPVALLEVGSEAPRRFEDNMKKVSSNLKKFCVMFEELKNHQQFQGMQFFGSSSHVPVPTTPMGVRQRAVDSEVPNRLEEETRLLDVDDTSDLVVGVEPGTLSCILSRVLIRRFRTLLILQ